MPRTLAPTIEFRSKYSQLRLLRRNAEQVFNPSYNTVSITAPEIVYEFMGGILTIERNRDLINDKYEDGEWKTQDALEWLRTHPDFNTLFVEVTPIAPDPSIILAEITDALIAGDRDRIEALGDEEYATWARPEVTDRLKAAFLSLTPDVPEEPAPAPAAKKSAAKE